MATGKKKSIFMLVQGLLYNIITNIFIDESHVNMDFKKIMSENYLAYLRYLNYFLNA